jgi:hypothetical protein
VGRLVAVGHGIWIGEPESAVCAATLSVRFRGAETGSFSTPYLSTTI